MGGPFPVGEVFAVAGVKLTVDPAPHPFVRDNEAAIAAHWQREETERPWLYNGTVLMHRALALDDVGCVTGVSHRVPYAALLHFIRTRPEVDCWHLFATAVPVAADGGLVLIRMAAQTANPGRVYSPAGSLDENDIAGPLVDIEGSMLRETMEEAGFDIARQRDMVPEKGLWAWSSGRRMTVFRRYRLPWPGLEAVRRIEHHRDHGGDREIAGAVHMRTADAGDMQAAMPDYMKAIAAFHFSDPSF